MAGYGFKLGLIAGLSLISLSVSYAQICPSHNTGYEFTTFRNTQYNYVVPVNDPQGTAAISVLERPLNSSLVSIDYTSNSLLFVPPPDWTGVTSAVVQLSASGCASTTAAIAINIVDPPEVCPEFSYLSAAALDPDGVKPIGRRGVAFWEDGDGDWWFWGGRSMAQVDSHELWKFTRGTAGDAAQWYNMTPTGANPPAAYDAAHWVGPDGNFWLLQATKIWKYTIADGTWADMTPGDIPAFTWPLWVVGANFWKGDNGDFYLHGDNNSTVWRYTIASDPDNLRWLKYNAPHITPDPWPVSRTLSQSWISKEGELYLFGGQEQYSGFPRCDFWKFNTVSNKWTRMDFGGIWPLRICSAATWTDKTGDLWMYGGYVVQSGSSITQDSLWQFTLATEPTAPRWVKHNPTSSGNAPWPAPVYMGRGWMDAEGAMWLYGGTPGYSSVHENTLWRIELHDAPETTYTTTMDTATTITPNLVGDTGAVVISVAQVPVHGMVTVLDASGEGSLLYTPALGFSGTDSFDITLSGESSCTENKTMKIHVRVLEDPSSRVEDFWLY